jgi:hypothetical protein
MAAVAVTEYVPAVAPATGATVAPPSVETSHWTVGVGTPVAAAVNDTGDPGATEADDGWVVTDGAESTVKVAGTEVADPAELVKTAS